jgi:hypothetical protein
LSWSEKSRYKRLLIVFNGGISGTRKAISQWPI